MTATPVLVGQFDSPYVRRVAVSAHLLGIAFDHRPWSVGRDQTPLRSVSPAAYTPFAAPMPTTDRASA